jgi:hypothetical protein
MNDSDRAQVPFEASSQTENFELGACTAIYSR